MAASVAGPEIERLIQLLARLPGLGPRSARRAALHLIKKREALMSPLAGALQVAIDRIQAKRILAGRPDRRGGTFNLRHIKNFILAIGNLRRMYYLLNRHLPR